MKPNRIQLSRAKGWRIPPNTIKVDRSTKWGNPFIVGKHGTALRCVELYMNLMCGLHCLTTGNNREQDAAVIHLQKHRDELRGKNLACWCRLDQPCHADVLLEIANK